MYLNRLNFGFSLEFDLTGCGVGLQVPCSITYYRLQESSIDTEYYCCFLAGHCQVPKHAQGSPLWNQLRLWHLMLHIQLGNSAAWCKFSPGMCLPLLFFPFPIYIASMACATGPGVNRTLKIDLNSEKITFNFKLVSSGENYSKFNVSSTLILKIMKSPWRTPTHQWLSNSTKNTTRGTMVW